MVSKFQIIKAVTYLNSLICACIYTYGGVNGSSYFLWELAKKIVGIDTFLLCFTVFLSVPTLLSSSNRSIQQYPVVYSKSSNR